MAALILTIKSVELKDDQGRWLKVIDPDRRVEVAEEPGLSFFPEGRVPEGGYVNFRVRFTGLHPEDGSKQSLLTANADLKQQLPVQRMSFIGIWFKLKPDVPAVNEASVTVDQGTVVFKENELRLEV